MVPVIQSPIIQRTGYLHAHIVARAYNHGYRRWARKTHIIAHTMATSKTKDIPNGTKKDHVLSNQSTEAGLLHPDRASACKIRKVLQALGEI
jgi:hypothetical protein